MYTDIEDKTIANGRFASCFEESENINSKQ
jgi:hypothetical protein